MVGARISSPHCSLLFPFFCFKYSFRFYFCKFMFFSKLQLPFPQCKPLPFFFLLFLFFSPFHSLCGKFRFPVQFCSFICRIAYCFVFRKSRLCSQREILKTTKTFKTEIRFCSFRIRQKCRQIPLAPDQCQPTFYGTVTCKCCIAVLHGPAIQRTEIPTLKGGGGGGGGARNGKDRVSPFLKLSGKDFLNGQF